MDINKTTIPGKLYWALLMIQRFKHILAIDKLKSEVLSNGHNNNTSK